MISDIFAGVRQRFRSFALGQSFNAQFSEGDYEKAQKWHDRAQRFHTEDDQARFVAESVETSITDVIHTAKKFEFTRFEDDPQAAIEKALQHLGEQTDINGETVTVARVMDHLGLDYEEPELAEALTV